MEMDQVVLDSREDLAKSGQPSYEPPRGVELGPVSTLTLSKSGSNPDFLSGVIPETGSFR
jgi:hypothetical protein